MKSPAGVRGPPRANQRWPGGQSHSNCPGWGQDCCSGIGSYKNKQNGSPLRAMGFRRGLLSQTNMMILSPCWRVIAMAFGKCIGEFKSQM